MEPVDENRRTVMCGNLGVKITEDLLYELFLQAGPVEKISLPKDQQGFNRGFAFILYNHASSVNYAINLLNNISLFNRNIFVKRPHNCPEEPQMPNPIEQNFNQLAFPQDMGFNVSALTPVDQPLIMPGVTPFGMFNFSGQVDPFGGMSMMYPSQMDNRFNEQNCYQGGHNSNWNNFMRGNNEDRRNNRSYDRSNERNYDKNNDRNFSRSNNRSRDRSHDRRNNRSRYEGFDRRDDRSREPFNRDRNYDGQNRYDRRNDGNSLNNRNFDRSDNWNQSKSDNWNQSRSDSRNHSRSSNGLNEGNSSKNMDSQTRKRDNYYPDHSGNKRSRK